MNNHRKPKNQVQHKDLTLDDFNSRIICPFNFYRPSKPKKRYKEGTSLSNRCDISTPPPPPPQPKDNRWLRITALSSSQHNKHEGSHDDKK